MYCSGYIPFWHCRSLCVVLPSDWRILSSHWVRREAGTYSADSSAAGNRTSSWNIYSTGYISTHSKFKTKVHMHSAYIRTDWKLDDILMSDLQWAVCHQSKHDVLISNISGSVWIRPLYGFSALSGRFITIHMHDAIYWPEHTLQILRQLHVERVTIKRRRVDWVVWKKPGIRWNNLTQCLMLNKLSESLFLLPQTPAENLK